MRMARPRLVRLTVAVVVDKAGNIYTECDNGVHVFSPEARSSAGS